MWNSVGHTIRRGGRGGTDGGAVEEKLALALLAEPTTLATHESDGTAVVGTATTDVAGTPHDGDGDATLYTSGQTQVLPDDFFALYASPVGTTASRNGSHHSNATADGGALRVEAGTRRQPAEEDANDREEDDGGHRTGRTDDHHAQQSQYVPLDVDPAECEDEEGTREPGDGSPEYAEATGDGSTNAVPSVAIRAHGPRPSNATAEPSFGMVGDNTIKTEEDTYWPHPLPPPLSALPGVRQSRVAFHSQRYGSFIKAYLGLSAEEAERAQRRGRSICMIGVRKVPVPSGQAASRADHHRVSELVRVQRSFSRHSVLAIEGDAVFSELIDRAEVLYAVQQQQLDDAWRRYMQAAEQAHGAASVDLPPPSSASSPYPSFARLPRVAEPYLRANARCIALHYGLPDGLDRREAPPPPVPLTSSTAAVRHQEAVQDDGEDLWVARASPGASPFPRATLLAVMCTNRLEEGDEVYVSLESYYRCLDEAAWYRRCYGELNRRSGCGDGVARPAGDDDDDREGNDNSSQCSGLVGDIYAGVRQFPEWPDGLTYYHGVGRRHASSIAQAAFPFTLVRLGDAPELGKGQKGVVATAWLPYGTCLLYCGPSVATRKVEKLVSERALRVDGVRGKGGAGSTSGVSGTDAIGTSSPISSSSPPPLMAKEGQEEEEDLSFMTDDTYALGLGRHGVCFGQGLTRYINHRYNISRFGNVELCSVMLSVPSEFVSGRSEVEKPSTSPSTPSADTTVARIKGAVQARREGAATVGRDTRSRRSLNTKRGMTTPVKEVQRTVDAKYRAPAAKTVSSTTAGKRNAVTACSAAAAHGSAPPKGRRRPPRRRIQCIFLEERSCFVTVPFFIVTTDIPPGASLLAWTYGEEYDAKLERQVVADGHLVPYADAELLNRRLAAASVPLPLLQRYNGDYRFAVGVGDVVWRRRPMPLSMRPCPSNDFGDDGFDALVPPPEHDLFVVVQTLRTGVARLLLRPLERVTLSNCDLHRLLQEQNLDQYKSPHSLRTSLRDSPRRHRGGCRSASASSRLSATVATHDWATHWALFRLTDLSDSASRTCPPLPSAFATTESHARFEVALRTCVVATVESLGLLLMDMDYYAVHRAASKTFSRDANAPSKGRVVRSNSASVVEALKLRGHRNGGRAEEYRFILVNIDDLRHSTALVRTSRDRATCVPALYNGLLWPTFAVR